MVFAAYTGSVLVDVVVFRRRSLESCVVPEEMHNHRRQQDVRDDDVAVSERSGSVR